MSREGDSKQLQAQYRGGCRVENMESADRADDIPNEIPAEAYVLEETEQKSFPENPRRAIPDEQPLTDLSPDRRVELLSEMVTVYADRLATAEVLESLEEITGESRDMLEYDIQVIRMLSDPDVLYSMYDVGDTNLARFIEEWREADGFYQRATSLGRGVNINAGHNVSTVVVPEIWRVLSGNAVLHKMPSSDQVTLRVLHDVYAEYDNPVANTCRISYWPGGSEDLEENLFASDYVLAWGDDPTIDAIRSRLAPTTKFVPFHFEFGTYLVDAETQHDYDRELLQRIAADFSWGDQLLCFSPLVMVIEDTDATTDFLTDLATVLEEYEAEYKMGAVPDKERMGITRSKKTARDYGNLISDWENKTTIVQRDGLERSDISEFHSFRYIQAHRVDSLEKSLDEVGHVRNLQEFILATSEESRQELREQILETNAKRIVSPGGAPPTLPIPWDGKHAVNELVRWVTDEYHHEQG
ncbi:acyl-CoA reductase [Halostella sp. PRR32]|uniref:acyl-CoA reductase n=1 Tax=Halostella sp. PRR32 TaxID=3098147 RepID=UPI002B1DE6D6|nr:acyl-CoA reductase [Halostella sp. PRR32]